LRQIKSKPKRPIAVRDKKIKKEPLFLPTTESFFDVEAIESSCDESDDVTSEEGRAFIDDGDSSISSRTQKRNQPNLGRPHSTARNEKDKAFTSNVKKEDSARKHESSSDEMDGIESVPDEDIHVKSQEHEMLATKSEDDSMDGIESVNDVESVSAQLDDTRPSSAQRPHHGIQPENRQHADSRLNGGPVSSGSTSDSDIEMLDDKPQHQALQPVQHHEDVPMGTDQGSVDGSDDDDLGLERYIRQPAIQTKNAIAAPQILKATQSPQSAAVCAFDDINGEEPYSEDVYEDCE
jgi:hypothetical protein